jgi:hypothetical protein
LARAFASANRWAGGYLGGGASPKPVTGDLGRLNTSRREICGQAEHLKVWRSNATSNVGSLRCSICIRSISAPQAKHFIAVLPPDTALHRAPRSSECQALETVLPPLLERRTGARRDAAGAKTLAETDPRRVRAIENAGSQAGEEWGGFLSRIRSCRYKTPSRNSLREQRYGPPSNRHSADDLSRAPATVSPRPDRQRQTCHETGGTEHEIESGEASQVASGAKTATRRRRWLGNSIGVGAEQDRPLLPAAINPLIVVRHRHALEGDPQALRAMPGVRSKRGPVHQS